MRCRGGTPMHSLPPKGGNLILSVILRSPLDPHARHGLPAGMNVHVLDRDLLCTRVRTH